MCVCVCVCVCARTRARARVCVCVHARMTFSRMALFTIGIFVHKCDVSARTSSTLSRSSLDSFVSSSASRLMSKCSPPSLEVKVRVRVRVRTKEKSSNTSHTLAIWTFTFHKNQTVSKANFKTTYRPNSLMFWSGNSNLLFFNVLRK